MVAGRQELLGWAQGARGAGAPTAEPDVQTSPGKWPRCWDGDRGAGVEFGAGVRSGSEEGGKCQRDTGQHGRGHLEASLVGVTERGDV